MYLSIEYHNILFLLEALFRVYFGRYLGWRAGVSKAARSLPALDLETRKFRNDFPGYFEDRAHADAQ